jgi:hypothetical protein
MALAHPQNEKEAIAVNQSSQLSGEIKGQHTPIAAILGECCPLISPKRLSECIGLVLATPALQVIASLGKRSELLDLLRSE